MPQQNEYDALLEEMLRLRADNQARQAQMGPPAGAAALPATMMPTTPPMRPQSPVSMRPQLPPGAGAGPGGGLQTDPATYARGAMETFGGVPQRPAGLQEGPMVQGDYSPASEETAPNGKPFANELEKKFFASTYERDRKQNELASVREGRQMVEGLGSIQVQSPGEILLGMPAPEKFVDHDARKREADLEYELAPENTPSSPESIAATKLVNQVTGQKLPEGQYSKAQLDQMFPAIAQKSIAQDRIQAAQEGAAADREFTAEQNELDRANRRTIAKEMGSKSRSRIDAANARKVSDIWNKERSRLLTHSRMTDFRKAREASERALGMLELEDNGSAIAGALVGTARASGEKGPISNDDLNRWEGYIGLAGMWEKGRKFASGEFTPEIVNRLKEVGQEMYDVVSEQFKAEAERWKYSFKSANKTTIDALRLDEDMIDQMYDDIFLDPDTRSDRFDDNDWLGAGSGKQRGPAPEGSVPIVHPEFGSINVSPEVRDQLIQSGQATDG